MNKIRLPRDGTEYARFYFNGEIPEGAALEASLNGGPWVALDTSQGVPRLLLRGPDATSGAGELVSRDSTIRVRVNDVPEQIVRGAGTVVLTS